MLKQLNPVLKVEEFADAFGIGRSNAFREIREGRLRAIKLGHSTRIVLADAFTWLEERRRDAQAALPAS